MGSKTSRGQTVADVMSGELVTLGRNETLTVADDVMNERRIRHVPVLDEDGELCGIVSQRDLFRGAVLRSLGYGTRAEHMMLESLLVKDAMTEDPVTVDASAPLAQAARLMLDRSIGGLPVVQGGKLVGIITEGDFVRLALDE